MKMQQVLKEAKKSPNLNPRKKLLRGSISVFSLWGSDWGREGVSEGRSSLTLCNPMDYTVHGILQARTLEWVAFPFSRRSSQPRDQTQVSRFAGRFFTSWATREAPFLCYFVW